MESMNGSDPRPSACILKVQKRSSGAKRPTNKNISGHGGFAVEGIYEANNLVKDESS